ncbi:MAG: hypothetical protein LBJ00_04375 [Planctomycetaceae bacterium]|nr:hypothetical protein [Planctomycetaceae bacterium]
MLSRLHFGILSISCIDFNNTLNIFGQQFLKCFGQVRVIYSSCFKFPKLITVAQQREAVAQGRSLPPIPASVYINQHGKNCNNIARFFNTYTKAILPSYYRPTGYGIARRRRGFRRDTRKIRK